MDMKPMTKKDWNDLIDSIEIPQQNRYLMVWSSAKDMIKMIIDNGGKEIERKKYDDGIDYITFQLSFNYDFKL